ncbi:hypothetical protein, partial [Pantoea eucalypti]|uniref:hypothetical protein n=1 Tax=Pantoea eucalypti TaxID=470933 RepID=UPI00289F2F7F
MISILLSFFLSASGKSGVRARKNRRVKAVFSIKIIPVASHFRLASGLNRQIRSKVGPVVNALRAAAFRT